MPDGFVVELWVDNIRNARQMALGDDGTLFVGSRNAGRVYAVPQINNPSGGGNLIVLGDDFVMPSGIAFHRGDLYVADINIIYRYPDIEASLPQVPRRQVVYEDLPTDRHHGWKHIEFGPDGRLYIPVGAPCNICEPELPYAAIHALNVETGERSLIARGVRNTVGFDWHPETGQLWFTENGRDWLGDDIPPCEINVVQVAGQHFGFPYVHGLAILDPEYGIQLNRQNIMHSGPALELDAHVAPLGAHFYRGNQFPASYRNQLLVAEHGSWNRTKKIGYRVMIGRIEGDRVLDYRPFLDGFLLPNGDVIGRPVDVIELTDGSILVSDDYAGVIYRVSYRND